MAAEPPPVVAWELCDYEGVMVPVGHACIGGGPPACPTSENNPCGICERCLAAQVADLQRYGSPGDLPDHPLT